ncbi:uncharacterized protein Gasu_49910 [Galdieria sulphuraria]|uniref:Uncharacterized protein n=1 Tax=Galdieria sulphuraria TaxID=130081 RepID=M2XUT5_GALSU|nr:uncharacterized protein Gasu_49910 [Galdieria sulphuraria]EME27393.1 hypothetical protein Gasu_49910 [Galdieria sulphuraria]|eukprot:XP_005703913.1 hypothetical protein Gasu_49910 [Galdieria sulphuraria]
MCIGELVGIGKKRSQTKLDSIVNLDEYSWTNSTGGDLDVWNSILQSADTDSVQSPRDIESIRQLIRQVCRRRRPGRPPLYVISETGAELKNEEERKFMEKILKRRIRQNKAYRRRKERDAKQKATRESSQEVVEYTASETVSKTSEASIFHFGEQFFEQGNILSFVSEKDGRCDNRETQDTSIGEGAEEQETDANRRVSLEEDECLQLRYLWKMEEQWKGVSLSGGSLATIRLIFERVRKSYLGLSMFLRDAYKSLSILPGYFDWRTACFIIGISSTSEQPGHGILQSLLRDQILLSEKGFFLMGPLEKSFALNSSVVRNEPQYLAVMNKAKERFVEYFLSKYFDINDYFFLQRATAKDIILSIYTNEKVNMDYCLKLIVENDIAKILDINLLNRCVHFFRYCASPETLIAIFRKALHQNACSQSLLLETCTESNQIAMTTCDCADMMCPDSWEIEAIARLKAAIGEAYCNIGDEEKGEYLLRQAVDLCAVEKLNTAINVLYRLGLRNSPFVTVALVSGILLDVQLGNMNFVKDSIAVIEDLPMTKEIPEVNAFLGYLYQWQGKGDVAQHYFQTALEVVQRKELSRNISELYIKHCGESNLESVLLEEIEDSCVEENKETATSVSIGNCSEEKHQICATDFQDIPNCNDGIRCFCFDFGKIGKSLKKMLSFVFSDEDSSGYDNTCVDDLLKDEDDKEILFNHPFFLA